MLQNIRDRVTSWVAYIIIGLLILSFALWGIQEYFGAGAATPIAKVNGTEISRVEFNNQLQQYKQYLQSILGNNYQQQYPDDSLIKKEITDIMVRTELLRQEATNARYRISDKNLIKQIQQSPQFQQDGKFNPALYQQWLQVRRYTKAQYERELREQEKLKQFEISLAASSFMPKADLQRFQKLSEQTRDFKFAVVKVDPETVTVSSEEIDSYFTENQQLFQTPERVKLVYIELKEEDLVNQINISADQALEIYNSHPERYMTDELRKARHILLRIPNELATDEAEWNKALEKANDLVKQLDEGASFTDLAKQHSQDKLSAEKGGELGFFAAGDFTSKDLEDALFSLKVGEYSQPVRTEQGIQIVKLDEIQEVELKPFETVREKIINERKSQMAQEEYSVLAEELDLIVYNQPDELPDAVGDQELQIKETDWLASNSSAEIFTHPEVQSRAFSEKIIKDELNSDLIEVADGHVIAFRLLEHQDSAAKKLEDVSEEIKNFLSVRKSAEQATAKGQNYLTGLQEGKTLESLATELSLEVVSFGPVRRDDSRILSPILDQVFEIPRPNSNQVSVDGIAMPDGSYVLVELSEIKDGAAELQGEKASQLSQRVNYGRREFNAVIDAIRQASDVEIFETDS